MIGHCKNALLEGNTGNTFFGGMCIGSIQAIVFFGASLPSSRGAVCAPSSATRLQGVRVVIRYLEENPNSSTCSFWRSPGMHSRGLGPADCGSIHTQDRAPFCG